MIDKNTIKIARRKRKRLTIRQKLSGTETRPRLAIFRSARNIYAQLIDDSNGRTLTGVSTLSPDLRQAVTKTKNKTEAARLVGTAIAEKADALKINSVVFDRGGYLYHGRIRAVAESARDAGLKF